MGDAIYLYVKKKLSTSLERCGWSDRVGSLFLHNIMPQIYEAIDSIQNVAYEIDDLLKKAENELNDG